MATENDYFKQLAQKAKERNEQEEKNRGNNISYDPILWSAFEDVGSSKVIRFYHNLIAQKTEDFEILDGKGEKVFDQFSPRTINLCTIYGDDHNKFFAYIPDKNDDPSHIFWRMYELVLKREWVPDPNNPDKKISRYIHKISHPELVDRFETNGFNHNISKNKFDRGWKPQKVIVGNIIDRARYEEHREHKHSFLLSKNVNYVEDKAYYDIGVPSYGFIEQVFDVVSIYGGLTSYDLLVERTGEKGTPWKIRNGSRYIEEVPEKLRGFVSDIDHITDEELSWELYDLDKIYKPTDHRKWFKKIKVLAKQIDLAFNTHFHEELEEKANKEQKEIDALKAETESNTTVQGFSSETESKEDRVKESSPKVEETPKRRRSSSTEDNNLEISWETLEKFGYKGKEFFTDDVKSLIEKITPDGDVVWKDSAGVPTECFEDCDYKGIKGRGFESPDTPEVKGCIWCSEKF